MQASVGTVAHERARSTLTPDRWKAAQAGFGGSSDIEWG